MELLICPWNCGKHLLPLSQWRSQCFSCFVRLMSERLVQRKKKSHLIFLSFIETDKTI